MLPPKNLVDSKSSLTHPYVRKGVRVRRSAQKYKYRNAEIQKYRNTTSKYKNSALTHPHVRKGVRVRGAAQLAARSNTHPEQAHSSKFQKLNLDKIIF